VYYGKPCGLMDQLACATGGVIALDFGKPFPEIERVDSDLKAAGYAMCIVDSRVSHADLSADFAAIPEEMCAVARYLDKSCLGEVEEHDFYAHLTALRKACGDRAVLRAMHFFKDDRWAQEECAAIARGDMDVFLELIRRSGRSSYMYLQNVSTYSSTTDLGLAVLLALAEQLVGERGACRVHGGGFAGTIQAFVPLDMLDEFIEKMEQLTGVGSCFVLSFRPVGTCCVLK
jgi:galactokinase